MEMSYPALVVLFVIVIAIWILGRIFPKIRRLRVSATASFILLCAAITILWLLRKFFHTAIADYATLILTLIILKPGGSIAFLIYALFLAADFDIGDKGIWFCILVFSFAINTLVIFGILWLVQYIREKLATPQVKMS